eukprot:m.992446 g.992446  ORF g.992446 m.992446 type:complete len:59 (-) comp24006_c0_seq11:2089-2265(-)
MARVHVRTVVVVGMPTGVGDVYLWTPSVVSVDGDGVGDCVLQCDRFCLGMRSRINWPS